MLAQTLLTDRSFEVTVLVVDNDGQRSAEATVQEFSNAAVPFRYVVEREQGIVRGRNRVLQEAQDWDFLALLDDDETANSDWLEHLMRAQRKYSADVVTGPVDAILQTAPTWIAEGGFFKRRSFPTGIHPVFVETNNVLISGSVAKHNRFDTRFDKTSGEDTYFFGQIIRDGGNVIWCEEARVRETIGPIRTTASWLIDRERSSANRYTRCCLYLKPGIATICARLSKALASLGIGVYLLLTSSGSLARQVRAQQRIGRFLGTISALRGKNHIYYKEGEQLT